MKPIANVAGLLGACLGLTVAGSALAGPYRVSEGSATKSAGLVTAGESGAVLTFQSGLVARLMPGAEVRVFKDADVWLNEHGRLRTELLALLRGRADFTRPAGKTAISGFLVHAGRGLLASTSQGEITAVASDRGAAIAASSGSVSVSAGKKWSTLPSGEEAMMPKGSKEFSIFELPPPPQLTKGPHLWVALPGPAKVGGFEWGDLHPEERYLVRVTSTDTGEVKLQRELLGSEVRSLNYALPAGKFAMTVQAEDAFGVAGSRSPAHPITVLGVEEHTGARLDKDGVIHVGVNQPVKFTNVEGLQVTYGSAMPWSPATASFILRDRERTRVHFRMAGTSETVSAIVEPRGATADIALGSKFAAWPRDTVQVSVQLRDVDGGLKVADIQSRIDVRIGIEPFPVEFRSEGSRFIGEIPPQPGPGPWVVRVTVTDQYGVELGREFLEVAAVKPVTPPAVVAAAREQSQKTASMDGTASVTGR